MSVKGFAAAEGQHEDEACQTCSHLSDTLLLQLGCMCRIMALLITIAGPIPLNPSLVHTDSFAEHAWLSQVADNSMTADFVPRAPACSDV